MCADAEEACAEVERRVERAAKIQRTAATRCAECVAPERISRRFLSLPPHNGSAMSCRPPCTDHTPTARCEAVMLARSAGGRRQAGPRPTERGRSAAADCCTARYPGGRGRSESAARTWSYRSDAQGREAASAAGKGEFRRSTGLRMTETFSRPTSATRTNNSSMAGSPIARQPIEEAAP